MRRIVPDNKIRILHVVGGMDRGGVETWLMHVLRHIDRARFSFDFLVHTTQPCAYDMEIRALKGNIFPCLKTSQPWRYVQNLKRIMLEHGPYDIVHSHVHHFSGLVLRQAQKAGVPIRIAHSHNDTAFKDNAAGFMRKTYLKLMAYWIRRHATSGIACSRHAAVSLFGRQWQEDRRWRVFYCGIDLKPFLETESKNSVRNELGIMPGAFVVGHVGSFSEAKNHRFLIEIFSEILKREPKAILLLIGDGPLRLKIEEQVAKMGISTKTIFAGARADVPRLMTGAMDIFVLPSLWEGLPLVLIESQAAQLPSVFSYEITDEVDIVLPLVHRISVRQPATAWADMVIKIAKKGRLAIDMSTPAMDHGPFNILFSCEKLRHMYEF
jgi:glycosyltransferase involved in cell wall biosynthesis